MQLAREQQVAEHHGEAVPHVRSLHATVKRSSSATLHSYH
jgi:hypothetical protein